MKPQHMKWVVLLVALFMFLGDLGELIARYQNWEFVNSTEFVAAVMIKVSKTAVTALSGNLFKSISGETT